jgi:type IV pilus assembly protein PilC
MNHEELSYFNLQLASMLRSGIPLEGALKQLVKTMHRGTLRKELEQLDTDLAAGQPLAEALPKLQLPEFYKQMALLGARSHDFPGILTLLADYYQKVNAIQTRLKGLMLYPLLLLVCSLGLSLWFAVLHGNINEQFVRDMHASSDHAFGYGERSHEDFVQLGYRTQIKIWLPPLLMCSMLISGGILVSIPQIRRRLRWQLPAFRETNLAQFGHTMVLLLQSGSRFDEAIQIMARLEQNSLLGEELQRWGNKLAAGHATLTDISPDSRIIPPLFTWLVASAGENLTQGFQRAAEMYERRATYRTEMLLYIALPVAILTLGLMIFTQVYPYMSDNLRMIRGVFYW